MDAAIDLSDASKALDLANIRFQLMYIPLSPRVTPSFPEQSLTQPPAGSKTQ